MSLIWATAAAVWILIGLSVAGLIVESRIDPNHWWMLPMGGLWAIIFGGGAGALLLRAIDQ